MTTVLGTRALNRSLLARQMLLERVQLPAERVMERLVGMQAQEPPDPYVALWTRLVDFNPEELVLLLESRAAVRATTMLRTTIHLVTATDAVGMRPILQPVAERTFIHTPFAKALRRRGPGRGHRARARAAGRFAHDHRGAGQAPGRATGPIASPGRWAT